MALGRIKRDREKVLRAGNRLVGKRGEAKKMKITVVVSRQRYGSESRQRRKLSAQSLYGASACIGHSETALRRGTGRAGRYNAQRCGFGNGRTPQNAIAKAVVDLGEGISRRGITTRLHIVPVRRSQRKKR